MSKRVYCNPSTILEFLWEFDLNVQKLRPVTLLIIGMLKKQNNSRHIDISRKCHI
jgi:hypothetical protein